MTEMNIPEMLREADKAWNAAKLSETIVAILVKHPEMTLRDIEDELRTFSKTTYLVAWPRHMVPPWQGQRVIPRNLATRQEMPYGLWVCLNGPDDMLQQVAEFGLTVEQNREALKQTGFNTVEINGQPPETLSH